MSVVDDVYDYLIDEGLVAGSTGWDILKRRMMDDPAKDQLVVVAEDGGPAPEMPAEAGIGDSALVDLAVHVAVRGEAWDGDATAAKCAAIMAALHGQRNKLIGSTTYLRVMAQAPQPVFIGFDDQGRPTHTQSFRCLAAAT